MQSNPLWPLKPDFPKLQKNIHTDVVVVGAGIAGISCAYFLKQKGYNVVVIEKDEVGSGATGASSGILYHGSGTDFIETAKTIGKKNAEILWNESMHSIDDIERLVKKNSLDCGFRKITAFATAKNDKEIKYLEKESIALKNIGFLGDIVDENYIKNYFMPSAFLGAMKLECSQLMPAKFVYAIAKLADIDVYQNTAMTEVKAGNVKTSEATINCNNIVIATNLQPLFGLEKHFSQENSVITASQQTEEVKKFWKDDAVIWTLEDQYDLIYTEAGRAFLELYNPRDINEKLKQYYPNMNFQKSTWGDSWSKTDDWLPIIGLANKNIFVAVAMGDQGIVTGFTAGRKISLLLEEKKDKFLSMVSPLRFEKN